MALIILAIIGGVISGLTCGIVIFDLTEESFSSVVLGVLIGCIIAILFGLTPFNQKQITKIYQLKEIEINKENQVDDSISSILCSKCNSENSYDANCCSNCGSKLNKKRFCQNCGEEITNQNYCQNCGQKIKNLLFFKNQ